MAKSMNKPFTVIISRTDSLGDVMLTLPLAGIIKKFIPGSRIVFLGKEYTKDLVTCCGNIDEFLSLEELRKLKTKERPLRLKSLNANAILHVFPDKELAAMAKEAGIPIRVGTSHRIYHFLTCNHLINFSRRKSDLHESQLNLKLLSGIGIEQELSTREINAFSALTEVHSKKYPASNLPTRDKFNLIIHPRSKGSAREWGLDNFTKLIQLLPTETYKIFITGTLQEGESMKAFIESNPSVVNLCGKLSLKEFIALIDSCQGLVAASTGPLHIASALGKKAIGIYAPMHPIDPGRWAPIGEQAEYLVKQVDCSDCRKSMDCHCIREIKPETVYDIIRLAQSKASGRV